MARPILFVLKLPGSRKRKHNIRLIEGKIMLAPDFAS